MLKYFNPFFKLSTNLFKKGKYFLGYNLMLSLLAFLKSFFKLSLKKIEVNLYRYPLTYYLNSLNNDNAEVIRILTGKEKNIKQPQQLFKNFKFNRYNRYNRYNRTLFLKKNIVKKEENTVKLIPVLTDKAANMLLSKYKNKMKVSNSFFLFFIFTYLRSLKKKNEKKKEKIELFKLSYYNFLKNKRKFIFLYNFLKKMFFKIKKYFKIFYILKFNDLKHKKYNNIINEIHSFLFNLLKKKKVNLFGWFFLYFYKINYNNLFNFLYLTFFFKLTRQRKNFEIYKKEIENIKSFLGVSFLKNSIYLKLFLLKKLNFFNKNNFKAKIKKIYWYFLKFPFFFKKFTLKNKNLNDWYLTMKNLLFYDRNKFQHILFKRNTSLCLLNKNIYMQRYNKIKYYGSLKIINSGALAKLKNYYINPLYIFKISLENALPILNITTKIISGKTQKIPTIIKNYENYVLVFRWLKDVLKNNKKYKYILDNLCFEFLLLYYKKSTIFKSREEFYSLILRNRSLLKYLKKK